MTKDQTYVPGSVPLSPRHEKFAQLMALESMPAYAAYAEVYEESCDSTARFAGPALIRKYHIRERVAFLQGEVARHVTMQAAEAIAFLEEVVRTPMNEVDEHCLSAHKKTTTTTKSGAKRVSVESMSKKDALDMLAKIAGWYKAEAPNEGGYVPTEEVAERVSQVALDNFGRRGDVAKVLAMFKKD